MRRRLLALCLLACAAASSGHVPEPRGYWLGPIHGPLPETLTGGTVIHTAALAALLADRPVVLVDVASAPIRPPHMAAGALWLPLPHRDIPGSVWIPDAGQGVITPALDASFRRRLATLSGHDRGTSIVTYCHERCWMSWNAAKRAISYGYRNVYWYPDGIEAWTRAGHPVAVVNAEGPGAAEQERRNAAPARYREPLSWLRRVLPAGLAALIIGTAAAQAAPGNGDAVLHSLIGKDEATIERTFGLPDRTERNGVQTFLYYFNADFWRTTPAPYPFGYSEGYSGSLGFRDRANFECTTTLVLTDGLLRAYSRQGSGCRQ